MREILFRGLNNNCEWVFGGIHYPFKDSPQIIHKQGNNLSYFSAVKPETVGQYTGLTTANGTKIFEGDTVRDDEKFHYDVYWCKKHLMWIIDGESLGDFSEIDLEIIGNIHEGEK